MLDTNAVDTLEDIKRWAEAYKILQEWHDGQCCDDNDCSKCGFNPYCIDATNLLRR